VERPAPGLLLHSAFFLSGLATLVHELIWARMLYPVFGMSIVAISVVVATFMAGIGLGSHLFGPAIDRARHPFRLYAAFEIGIGLLAFCMPRAIGALPDLQAWVAGDGAPAALRALRLALVAGLLLPPCVLMGGTFPAFARGYVRSRPRLGPEVALLYALNALGGAAGCLLAGVLIPTLSLSLAVYAAAALNVALGLAVWLFAPVPSGPAARDAAAPPARARRLHPVLAILFLTGFLSFSYEILWTRALLQLLRASYFSFSLILTAMLVGTTLGSAASRALFARLDPRILLAGLAALLFAACAGSFLGVFRLVDLADLAARVPVGDPGLQATVAGFLVCFLAFLPTSVLFGAMFPISLQLYAGAAGRLGSDLGRAYAVNTAGSVIGILLTGLVLMERLGSGGALVLLLLLTLGVLALALPLVPGLGRAPRRAVLGLLAGLGALMLAFFPQSVFLAHQAAITTRSWQGQAEVLFQGEDATSMATVTEIRSAPFRYAEDGAIREGRRRIIFHSNLLEVGGTRIYEWNVAGAYLAGLLHPDPRHVLMIGYGSGRQLATLLRLPRIERVDVVELSRVNVEASEYFYVDARASLADPRVRFHVDDGRNFLLHSERHYDVIVVDVGGLGGDGREFFYTREFLELCREHLEPAGLLFTWLQYDRLLGPIGWMYQNTFRSVFPDAAIWYGARTPSAFSFPWIVGARGGFAVDYPGLRARWDALAPAQRLELALVGIRSPEELLSLHAANLGGEIPERIARARILRDDHPPLWRVWQQRSGLDDLFALDFVGDASVYAASFGHLLADAVTLPVRGMPPEARAALERSRSELFDLAREGFRPAVRSALSRELERGAIGLRDLEAFAAAADPAPQADRHLIRAEARSLLERAPPRAPQGARDEEPSG